MPDAKGHAVYDSVCTKRGNGCSPRDGRLRAGRKAAKEAWLLAGAGLLPRLGTLRDAVQVWRAPHWECARCKTVVLCYGDFTAIIPKTAKAKTNQFIRPHRTSRGCLTSQQLPGRRWVQVQGRRALGETPGSQGTSRPPAPPPPGIQTCFSGGSGSISRGWGLSWEGKSPWPMEGPGQGQVQPPHPAPCALVVKKNQPLFV